jgi:diguanylate cyclase (GGDEF)-like protein
MTKTVSFEEHRQQKTGLQMRRNISNPASSQALDSNLYELINILQSTLDLGKLLELFDDELASAVPHDGLVYELPDEDIHYQFGEQDKHQCHYNLILLDKFLGQIAVSRDNKFTDDELKRIEVLTAALLYPIRNALLYKQALKTAFRDPLTGLNNRAALDNDLGLELDFAQRHVLALSIIILDLDKFKDINDTYGHIAGDDVLKKLAECMAECIRRSDIIYRYGGEEFIILLRNTATAGARLLAERIRKAVKKLVCKHNSYDISVTASLGVATLKSNETKESFMQRADTALYQAKEQGRNRTVIDKSE